MPSRQRFDQATIQKTLVSLQKLIVGTHPVIEQLRELITLSARSLAPVLIQGATGTGKEIVAQAIHKVSGRNGPFVAVNCVAIPEDLLEAELFGHEKGAYTGALREREGLIASADGGTLFLDEIGDMPLMLQGKILRALETRSVLPVGGTRERKVNFRLVTATHRNLADAIETGSFRADLYYRIAVLRICVPTLQERCDDIPQLLTALMTQIRQDMPDIDVPEFDASAIAALKNHAWPGNVRELRNVAERAAAHFSGCTITGEDVRNSLLDVASSASPLPAPANETHLHSPAECISHRVMDTPRMDLRAFLRDIEVSAIETALRKNKGRVLRAADTLGLSRTTLIEKMHKFSILRPPSDDRPRDAPV